MSKNYQILTTQEERADLLSSLEEINLVSFDIETNTNIEKIARVIGIGLCFSEGEAFYVPFAKFDPAANQLADLIDEQTESKFVKDLCNILLKKQLVMHNGVFDITVIRHRYDIDLTPALYSDTILMKHTLDEERPFGLKEVAEKYKEVIGFSVEEAANQEQLDLKESVIRNGGKWTKEQKDIYKSDLELIAKYCCADVDLTAKLFDYFEDQLEKENLSYFFYKQEVMPLYKKVTIPMKYHGVFVNIEYFKQLERELESDIIKLTASVFDLIKSDIQPLVEKILDDKVKETKTGKFAERVLQYYSIPIPLNVRTGKPTLAKSALQSLLTSFPDHPALRWLLDPNQTDVRKCLPVRDIYAIKQDIFVQSKPELPYVFNLASNDHLSWLIFECYKETPKSYSRETEKPQVNKDSLETYDHLPFIKQLLELKKQEKLLSTYVKPILETNIDGWIYPSMLQFGTTSGRYSCAGGLNLQTLPRDDKRIKRGFISPPGYKVVNADFASLEPRIFSWVCGDRGLKRVWNEGLDLYSQIAIDVFGLQGVSARESDKNYLKKVDNDSRQKSKTFTLAVPYGANKWRIAEQAKVDPETAGQWIDDYLETYPGLKKYMLDQETQAKYYGFVKTKFGRIRHLNQGKELYKTFKNDIYNKRTLIKRFDKEFGSKIYYEFRNQMNNAKNFCIQATAAHVCNAAMIELADLLKQHKIKGWICLTIHDEISLIIAEEHAELASKLLKQAMENNYITKQIDIPIKAEPMIGNNFAETK